MTELAPGLTLVSSLYGRAFLMNEAGGDLQTMKLTPEQVACLCALRRCRGAGGQSPSDVARVIVPGESIVIRIQGASENGAAAAPNRLPGAPAP